MSLFGKIVICGPFWVGVLALTANVALGIVL
jgi:hypothetical protein